MKTELFPFGCIGKENKLIDLIAADNIFHLACRDIDGDEWTLHGLMIGTHNHLLFRDVIGFYPIKQLHVNMLYIRGLCLNNGTLKVADTKIARTINDGSVDICRMQGADGP